MARPRRFAIVVAAVTVGAAAPTVWGPPAVAQVGVPSLVATEQAAVVTQRHQPAIQFAQQAVAQVESAIGSDQVTITANRRTAAQAASDRDAALSRLASDRAALVVAVDAIRAARARLAGDRDRLRSIATALYTGQITNPQPASVQQLEADQQAVIFSGELQVVTGVVVRDLKGDVGAAAAAAHQQSRRARQVDDDQLTAANATETATAALARAQSSAAVLSADQARLGPAQAGLTRARAALQSDLAALAGPGPAPANGLSILGGPALDAGQLTAWFNAQGYADLTGAPIDQLAAWYVQAGAAEGVRGDVAFAQAVLETGGFSSPDAVNLNNYAGIGHCDTCASGWTFPSPHGGVVGQLQLLQIFADSGPAPAGSPAPVMAALVPARESRRGCCPSWASLTGIWATDPTYGAQILGIYEQMLAFALNVRV